MNGEGGRTADERSHPNGEAARRRFRGPGAFMDSRAAALDSRTGAIFERGDG